MNIAIKTLGELNKTDYTSKSIKAELRDNLIENIKHGKPSFQGIHGYDETVIPQLERAILSQHNIKTENSLRFNPELSLKKGIYSKVKPNKKDKTDILKAIKTLNSLGQYNFSQGTIVRDNRVVAIEGKAGTEKMLKNIKSKKFNNYGVLVKFPKKRQDLRIDLPTVGLKTLKQCKIAGLKGLVVKSKQNVFLDKSKCIDFANKNKMFIIVI